MPDWREQEATNQTIFREMNEWTEEANDRHVGRGHAIDAYLCECSDRGCSEPIDLTRLEYEYPVGRHALRDRRRSREPGDRPVVAENERFATVEKFGAAARIARSTDPRRTR